MRRDFRKSIISLAVPAVAVLGLSLTVRPTAGQQQHYKAPRLVGTQHPDLNGVWQSFTTADWDIEDHPAAPGPYPHLLGAWGAQPAGPGIVEGGVLPYRPEALAKKRKNFETRMTVDPFNFELGEPTLKCYLPGVPRAAYMSFPFHILQGGDLMMMAYGFGQASRVIHIGTHPKAPGDSWMGWSNGRWEGETLVVDVTDFNGQQWLDRAGNYNSDALHVIERYTPISPDHLMYEATLDDPKVFTRPWKISLPLYRRIEPNVRVLENKCVEFTEELIYGTLLKK